MVSVMNKLLFSVVIVLSSLLCFVGFLNTSENVPTQQEVTETPIVDKPQIKYENKYLFIGDSRFVGMQSSIKTDKNITWIDKVGARHDYYWDNLNSIMQSPKDIVIIYELGVNDLDANKCLKVLNNLVNNGFTNVYFLTTTPVDDYIVRTHGYSVNNRQISEFNSKVINNIPKGVKVIDCYSYLQSVGINTDDGLHYTSNTYNKWFKYILDNIS